MTTLLEKEVVGVLAERMNQRTRLYLRLAEYNKRPHHEKMPWLAKIDPHRWRASSVVDRYYMILEVEE